MPCFFKKIGWQSLLHGKMNHTIHGHMLLKVTFWFSNAFWVVELCFILVTIERIIQKTFGVKPHRLDLGWTTVPPPQLLGPVYRPSTDKFHHFVKKNKKKLWHVIHDMWHVTRWGGRTFSQNFSSLALNVCDYMVLWRYGGKGWLTHSLT